MFYCPECPGRTAHLYWCERANFVPSEPLADWEKELLTMRNRPEGEGDVTFHRTDGTEFSLRNVRVDSIGPSAENKGVIGVEFFDKDDVVHVPFVQFWTIEY